jgi:hypothetical protein
MDGGSPCPEDGDFFYARPDATETEEAISKFNSGLECHEPSCFESLHTLLSKRPVPVATACTTGSKMSHAAALEGGFLPKMDEEQQKRYNVCLSMYMVYTLYIPYTMCVCLCTWYINCTFMYMHCMYDVYCICLVYMMAHICIVYIMAAVTPQQRMAGVEAMCMR